MPEALSLSNVINLLPVEFRPNTIFRKKPQLIKTPLGIVEFHATKRYEGYAMPIWWTATSTLKKYDVQWIVISLGYDGIILMPTSVIIDYANNNHISMLKFERQCIRIKRIHSRYFMYDSRAKDLDITPYFIPT